MEITYRQCTSDDIHVLRDFACKTFDETFSHMNTQSNMKAYLEQAFNVEKLRGELSDANSVFTFLYFDGELAGYMKTNESSAQTDIHDDRSLEVERIYVAKEFQGKGLGHALMAKAIDIAKRRERAYIWLGVWEKNDKAILFYKKNGFYVIGTHSFFVGEEEQTDYIMRKDV